MPKEPAKPPVAGRPQRSTPEPLRNLRSLRVAVVHPRDADGDAVLQQLQRIGCQVQAFWPPPSELPERTDVVFCAVRPDLIAVDFDWARLERPPAVVAIVNYENPTIVDAMLRCGARAVITSPVRSAGILSTLVLAHRLSEEHAEQRRRIARLEQKLSSANQVSDAKLILMRTRGVSDTEAYRLLREQAMSRRVPVEEIARAIIQANEILSFERGPGSE